MTTIEDFTRLQKEAQRLRDSLVRYDTERKRAQKALDDAERKLQVLGFDLAVDHEKQLKVLKSRFQKKFAELIGMLDE